MMQAVEAGPLTMRKALIALAEKPDIHSARNALGVEDPTKRDPQITKPWENALYAVVISHMVYKTLNNVDPLTLRSKAQEQGIFDQQKLNHTLYYFGHLEEIFKRNIRLICRELGMSQDNSKLTQVFADLDLQKKTHNGSAERSISTASETMFFVPRGIVIDMADSQLQHSRAKVVFANSYDSLVENPLAAVHLTTSQEIGQSFVKGEYFEAMKIPTRFHPGTLVLIDDTYFLRDDIASQINAAKRIKRESVTTGCPALAQSSLIEPILGHPLPYENALKGMYNFLGKGI